MPADSQDWVSAMLPQVNLGSVAAGNASTFALPAGTHALALVPASGAPQGQLTVTGTTSGQRYLNTWLTPLLTPEQYVLVDVISVYDTQVSVSNLSNAAVQVVAILDTEAVHVLSNPSVPLYVLPPPPTHLFVNVTLAAGATAILIGGALSVPHRLLRATLSYDANAPNTVQLEDGIGTGYWGATLAGPHQVNFGGMEANLNTTVRLHNYAGVQVIVRGFLQYIPGG